LFLNLEIFSIFLIFFVLKESLYLDEEYNWFIKNSDVNFWIVLLVFILYIIMLIVEINFKISLNFLFIVLLYIIIISDLISFFLFYEMVFILIIFVIVLLGYRFERLIAAFLIIFYSFLFSSPILIILLLFDKRFLMKEWLSYSIIINYFFCRVFYSKVSYFWSSLLASCSSCWSIYYWFHVISRSFVKVRFCWFDLCCYIYEFYSKISLVSIRSCFNYIDNFKIKWFKNNNCLLVCCSYIYSFLYFNIRMKDW